jgi:NAD+-dependent secondary alcohol dehydrogenase Adh1
MRAALLTQYRQGFSIGTVREPTIASPDDVIVRVGAAVGVGGGRLMAGGER